jgi:hypothetical protein
MEERAAFLIDYADEHGPVTVRGLYYQCEVAGVPGIGKDEKGYRKVQRQVLKLRRSGRLPYDKIADATRWMRKPRTYNSIEDALHDTARSYRRNLWQRVNAYVEIWVEKDAVAGVIDPTTEIYDVALMVARGYTSETFAFESVEARGDDPRPYHVYYLGDFDRAGRDAARALEEKLRRFAIGKPFKVYFHIIAVTEQQIREWRLPTREPKRKTAADKKWPHAFAVELDAIPADDLRALVENAILEHLPRDQMETLRVVEESERTLLRIFARQHSDDEPSSDEEPL